MACEMQKKYAKTGEPMKDDEKLFFVLCVRYSKHSVARVRIREIIEILHACNFIHYKRCIYLLEKWSRMGFYEWGVTMDLGWFDFDNLPERYAALLKKGT